MQNPPLFLSTLFCHQLLYTSYLPNGCDVTFLHRFLFFEPRPFMHLFLNHNPGTALYEAVACVFIAQLSGIQLTNAQLVITALTATVAAIGTTLTTP